MSPPTSRRPPRAFTLVEILVALTVLAVLVLLIAQIISAALRTTALSNRKIDATAQARLAFDNIGADLAEAVKRKDCDFQAQNQATGSADPVFLFLSSVTSAGVLASANRGLSVVAYRVAAHVDNQGLPCLIRAGRAIPWGAAADGGVPGVGFMGLQADGLPLPFSGTAFAPFLPGAPDYDILAAGVIRMVVGFRLYPDNLPVTLADGTALANSQGQLVYSPPIRSLPPNDGGSAVNYVDPSRIGSVVVGLVALDLNSLKPLNATQVGALAGMFPIPAMGTLPVRAWTPLAVEIASQGFSGIPSPARQSLRVFERFYPVTPFATKGL